MDPLSKREYLIWEQGRAYFDGRGGWRIETEDTTCVGPKDLATTVRLQTLHVAAQAPAVKTVSASILLGGSPNAKPSPAYLGEVELRRGRHFGMEELVAREGYATLVAWAVRLLKSADDLQPIEDEHGVGVKSESMGMELWAEPTNGEVTGVRVAYNKMGPSSWWFEGRFSEPLFPARHPRLLRMRGALPGSMETTDGRRLLYQRVEAKPLDPAIFETRNLAQKFRKSSDLTECDADGLPIAKPAEIKNRKAPATSEAAAAALADSATRTPRSIIAAAIACFLVAGMVWWRRSKP